MGNLVVLGAIVVAVGAIWSQMADMVSTLNTGGRSMGGGGDLKEVVKVQALEGTMQGGDADLLEATRAVAQATQAVRPMVQEAPPLPPPPPPPAASAAEVAARDALRRGDCVAAADHAVAAVQAAPGASSLFEETWRCFDGQGGASALGGLAALGGGPPPAQATSAARSAESRLSSFASADALGFAPYLNDMLGAATITAGLVSDLSTEALLAEWAAAAPRNRVNVGFLSDRVQALSGGLAGAAGDHVGTHAPSQHAQLQQRLDALMSSGGLPADVMQGYLDGLMLGVTDPLAGQPATLTPEEAADGEGEAAASAPPVAAAPPDEAAPEAPTADAPPPPAADEDAFVDPFEVCDEEAP